MTAIRMLTTLAVALAAMPALAATKAPPPRTCDEACLTGIADTYLGSLVAHDAGRLPLAADVAIVENSRKIKPGEGFWKSAAALPTTYKIVVPDAIGGQVALMAVLTEDQGEAGRKPVQLGARLKLVDGRIVEIEQMVVHTLGERNLANLDKPRAAFSTKVPEPYRDSRARLLTIGASYYDALDENNGRLAPFAPDCVRLENGFQTARLPVPKDNNPRGMIGALTCEAQLDSQAMRYITRIIDRRMVVANEELGIAVGFSHFVHDMTEKEYRVFGVPGAEQWKMDYKPFDLPAIHFYKIYGGQIHEIEAMGFTTDHNAPTGWEK